MVYSKRWSCGGSRSLGYTQERCISSLDHSPVALPPGCHEVSDCDPLLCCDVQTHLRPNVMGLSDHELRLQKQRAKINLSIFKIVSKICLSQGERSHNSLVTWIKRPICFLYLSKFEIWVFCCFPVRSNNLYSTQTLEISVLRPGSSKRCFCVPGCCS